MNRRVAVALVCTLLALVAATCWVPVNRSWQAAPGSADPTPRLAIGAPVGRCFPWEANWTGSPRPEPEGVVPEGLVGRSNGGQYGIDWNEPGPGAVIWRDYLIQILAVIAVGGLLALAFHLADRRKRAESA